MQNMRTWKRVGALMLTLTMLIGMLSMLGGLSFSVGATVSEDLKFKADFSELAAIAEEGGVYADATSYRPGYITETDKAIAAWVDARFDMASGYGKTLRRAILGQGTSNTLTTGEDNYSGNNYWTLNKDGYIQHATKNSGQVYRLVESFIPKVEGKQVKLANFEAKVTFAIASTSTYGQGVLIAFHEDVAANTRNQGDHVFQDTTGSLVLLNNGAGSYTKTTFGLAVYDHNNKLGKDGAPARAPLSAMISNEKDGTSEGNYNYYANRNVDGAKFENNLVNGTKYDLIVKVVGTKVNVTVKETETGVVVHTKEKTLEKADEGYFSVGSGNGSNRIYAIEIQELNEKGTPVPFGTKTGFDEVETLKIDFSDMPEATWYNGKYYYNPDHDTADVSASVAVGTDKLTEGTTSYTIDKSDDILVDYLESKFKFYYSQEGANSFERDNVNGYVVDANGTEWTARPSSSSATIITPDTKLAGNGYVDGVGYQGNYKQPDYPIGKWFIAGNKWLAFTNNGVNGNGMFRKSSSIAIKDKNGELLQIDNFKLDLDFKMYADGTYDHSAIAIGFHSNQPYMERARQRQGVFAISPFGGYLFGDSLTLASGTQAKSYNKNTKSYDDITLTADTNLLTSHGTQNPNTNNKASVWQWASETAVGHNTEAHLTLTVVGAVATAKVTVGETIILEKTVTLNTYYGSGYLFLSGSNQQGYYGNIEVTRLDQNGNPVDFSDDNEGWTFGESFDAKAVYYHKDSKYWRDTGADMFWMAGGQATNYTFDKPDTYATDKATVDHLNEKFNLYTYFGSKFAQLSTPYQNSEEAGATDTWSGVGGAANYARWVYSLEGLTMITGNGTAAGGEALRKGMTLSPKVNGELIKSRNVEVSTDLVMTYNANNLCMWNISLRSKDAGKIIDGNNDDNNKYADHIAIQITPAGVNIVDGKRVPQFPSSIKADENYKVYRDGQLHYNVRVYAKVVNDKLTVRVTDSKTDAVLFEEIDKTVSYIAEGYVTLSTGQVWSAVSNLYVNTLDGLGNVTDPSDDNPSSDRYVAAKFEATHKGLFPYGKTNQTAAGIPAYLQTGANINGEGYLNFTATGQHFTYKNREYKVADGYSLVTENGVTSVMKSDAVVVSTADYTVDSIAYTDNTNTVIKVQSNNAEMNTLVNDFISSAKNYLSARYDAYYIDTDYYKGASLFDNGWGTEVASIYGNEWLQFRGMANTTTKKTDAPADRHVSLLVPKNMQTNELITADEFTMNFRLRLADAGTFGTAYVVFNMPEAGNIGKAAVSNAAIDFGSDLNAIKINSSQFMFWNGTKWVDLIANSGYTGANHTANLSITVKDGKLTGSIHFDGKSAQSFEVALTNTHEGYMAIGQNGIGVDFGAITIDLGEQETKVATVKKTEGGKISVERVASEVSGFYKYKVTADAKEGWMLKANTLIGTETNGNKVYPAQRVGFREDVNGGDSYYFYSAEDIVFDAEFYTAMDATEANVGNVGTSYNEAKYGLRFIGRAYVTTENGVKYTEIDGKKYEVVDYGMLFAVEEGLKWGAEQFGTEMTIDNENPYISRKSAVEANVHYDVAGNYVDVATTIVGLEGYEDVVIYARTYVSVKVGNEIVNAYSQTFYSSFLDNVDLKKVVYLDAVNGDDANAGTEDAPVKTLQTAISKTIPNGKVVNMGEATLPATFGTGNATKMVILTGGTYKFDARHTTLNSPVTFENTTLHIPDYDNTEVWFAAGHKLVIKNTVTMEGHFDSLYGGVYQTKDLERTDLEIYAGNYHNIIGGSAKKYVAETHVTVGGNVNAALRSEAEGGSHNVGVWGGGVESADTGDTYITFGGNAYAYMIYGGSSQGGTISGDTHVTITGGECAQVFGGCDRVSMTGNTNVTVTGGTITRRMYGGCYNENNSTSFHVTGNTIVTIGEGLNYTKTGQSSASVLGMVDAYEGIRAGSRAATNYSDEVSTLIFLSATAKSKNAGNLGQSSDAGLVSTAFGAKIADTTDTTTVK